MNIPEEAVEAAAEAMYLHDWAEDSSVDDAEALWATETRRARNTYTQLARAALEAAAPLLMAQALREMAETFDPLDTDPIKSWHPHDVAELLRWRASDITTYPTPTHRRPPRNGTAIFVPKEIEMSTKLTREQIQKARDKADDAAAKFGMSTNEERAWIDTFTEALGLDVEDEKPEPGTWHVVKDEGAYANQIAYVGGHGNLLLFTDNGDYDNLAAGMDWPALTPARVIPAEPVERPDWDDVQNAVADSRGNGWGLNDEAINAITDAVIALLGGGDRG